LESDKPTIHELDIFIPEYDFYQPPKPTHNFFLKLKRKRDSQLQPLFFVIYNKNNELCKNTLDKFKSYDKLITKNRSELVESACFVFDFESVKEIDIELNDGYVYNVAGTLTDQGDKSMIFAVFRSELYGSLRILDRCDRRTNGCVLKRFIKQCIAKSIEVKKSENLIYAETLKKYARRRRVVEKQTEQYEIGKTKDELKHLELNDKPEKGGRKMRYSRKSTNNSANNPINNSINSTTSSTRKSSRKRKQGAGDAFITLSKSKKISKSVKLVIQFEHDHKKSKILDIRGESTLKSLGFSEIYTYWPNVTYDLNMTIEEVGFTDSQVIYVKDKKMNEKIDE